MRFECRVVKPKETQWVEQEAETPELAASEFHFNIDLLHSAGIWHDLGDGRREKVWFCQVEVNGYGTWFSRVFQAGLWRQGGVKSRYTVTLADIAIAIEWTGDPQELLSPNWECEETYEGASTRIARTK